MNDLSTLDDVVRGLRHSRPVRVDGTDTTEEAEGPRALLVLDPEAYWEWRELRYANPSPSRVAALHARIVAHRP